MNLVRILEQTTLANEIRVLNLEFPLKSLQLKDVCKKFNPLEGLMLADPTLTASRIKTIKELSARIDSSLEISTSQITTMSSHSVKQLLLPSAELREVHLADNNSVKEISKQSATLNNLHQQPNTTPIAREYKNIFGANRELAAIANNSTKEIRRSRFSCLRSDFKHQLLKLEAINKQGAAYLKFDRALSDAIACGDISAKEAKVIKQAYYKKTGDSEKNLKLYKEFHQYWSSLLEDPSAVSRKIKWRLVRFTLNHSFNWIFNFIGITWEQLQKIRLLPKITKAAIASILQKTTQPRPTHKIKYKQPLEEVWAFLENKKDELDLNSSEIEAYQARGFKSTFELIQALEQDERPIANLIDKRSKPPVSNEPLQLSLEEINNRVREEVALVRSNYQAQIEELEQQKRAKEKEIAELKASFESRIKELDDRIKEKDQQLEAKNREFDQRLKIKDEQVKQLNRQNLSFEERLNKLEQQNQPNQSLAPGVKVRVNDPTSNCYNYSGVVSKEDTGAGKWLVWLDCEQQKGSQMKHQFLAEQLIIISPNSYASNNSNAKLNNNHGAKANNSSKNGFGKLIESHNNSMVAKQNKQPAVTNYHR